MKKRTFATLAMLGVGMALLGTGCQSSNKMSPEMKQFCDSLPPEVQKKFKELDQDHKKATLEKAGFSCNAKSAAKCGNNACNSKSAAKCGNNTCNARAQKIVEEQYQHQMLQRQSLGQ